MTKYEAGDIVLVRYPFTDLSTTKKRPVVVLSEQDYVDRYGDIILMPFTGQSDPAPALALREWRRAGLLKPTWLKPIIGTLSARLVEKHLGKLQAVDEPCVRAALE